MISNKLSGWYYDLQLDNRLTSVSLHPNKILNDKGKWVNFDYESNNAVDPNLKELKEADPDYTEYRKIPICQAIVTEDFSVSVANSWSDFGGDMIGQMWESLKPMAPYADFIKSQIHNAAENYRSMAGSSDPKDQQKLQNIQNSKVSSAMAKFTTRLDESLQKADKGEKGGIDVVDYLNRSLVVQGTRFSYYSGSGTSFGNLVMKFTLFPKYEYQYQNGYQFITVTEQVEELLPYCIGKFVNASGETKEEEEQRKKEANENGKKLDETEELINSLIGWQLPPGGFKTNYKNVDVIQEGTLMLRVGAFYTIPNLVIENVNFNFSKQMTKDPTQVQDVDLEAEAQQKEEAKKKEKEKKQPGENTEETTQEETKAGSKMFKQKDVISPLYCDVTLQLRPATKYSDNSLRKFILSRGTKILKETSDTLRNNLEERPIADKYNYVY